MEEARLKAECIIKITTKAVGFSEVIDYFHTCGAI